MPDDSDDENNLVIDYEDWENENNEVEAFSHSFCDDLEKGIGRELLLHYNTHFICI